ncbi:hypothetical protein BGY98DRAFT_688177 [Russula aff. rugulosa BPL654]|nr:hypothetical protein BGY98DRAFT_688177 [Russula aff. rugulosa BPL654]
MIASESTGTARAHRNCWRISSAQASGSHIVTTPIPQSTTTTTTTIFHHIQYSNIPVTRQVTRAQVPQREQIQLSSLGDGRNTGDSQGLYKCEQSPAPKSRSADALNPHRATSTVSSLSWHGHQPSTLEPAQHPPFSALRNDGPTRTMGAVMLGFR